MTVSNSINDQPGQDTILLMPPGKWVRVLVIATLFLAAFGLRFMNISEPMVEFHPLRQYRGAIIARGIYLENNTTVPTWQREMAVETMRIQGSLEPEVMETLVAWTYGVIGGEHLWVARLYSILFWLGGGIFLYLLAARLFNADAALFAAGFYLLLPFAVMASRTFQPDSLMMLFTMASAYFILRYAEEPGWQRLILAAVVASIAVWLKPICGPMILGMFVGPHIARSRSFRGFISPQLIVFGVIFILPTLVHYIIGYAGSTMLQSEFAAQFIPALLLTRQYWGGLLLQVGRVVGSGPLLLAILGIMLINRPLPRAVLGGMWAGYLVFVLMFTYVASTHDYYQLQLVPLVALCLAPVAANLMAALRNSIKLPITRMVLLMTLVLLAAIFGSVENQWRRYYHFYESAYVDLVSIAPEIGEAVNHSNRTVTLSHSGSLPLYYHAWIGGAVWPHLNETRLMELSGEETQSTIEMLDSLAAEYDYFIVTAFAEFDQQPDLKRLLYARYPVLVETESYIIFDLRASNE
jgi:hypothetical protein